MFFGLFGLPFVLIIALVLLALAGKSEPDEKRERPAALYLSIITLIGVLLLLTGTFLVANGLVELTDTSTNTFGASGSISIGSDDNPFDSPRFKSQLNYGNTGANHDDDISQVIGGVIVGAIAVAVLRFHQPKLQELADNSEGPGARVYARLLYVVCGATLLTALGAAGTGVYAVYGMIAPDTAGAGEVSDALRTFLSAAALALASAYVFRTSWSHSEDLAAVGAAASEPDTDTTD